MPGEHTNSFITWLNSPNCGNQTTQTIVDMIRIGQWYRPEKNVNKMSFTLIAEDVFYYVTIGR